MFLRIPLKGRITVTLIRYLDSQSATKRLVVITFLLYTANNGLNDVKSYSVCLM